MQKYSFLPFAARVLKVVGWIILVVGVIGSIVFGQIESQNATTRLTFCQHTCPKILCGVGPEQCEIVSFRSQ